MIMTTLTDARDYYCNKLATLVGEWGYDDSAKLLEDVERNVTSPGICANQGCKYTAEVSVNQSHGWCNECRTWSVISATNLHEISTGITIED